MSQRYKVIDSTVPTFVTITIIEFIVQPLIGPRAKIHFNGRFDKDGVLRAVDDFKFK